MRLETERLVLRNWRLPDRAAYAQFCADPEVRRHFPSVLGDTETGAMLDLWAKTIARSGMGFCAATRKSDDASIGSIGLARVDPATVPGDVVEIGWLLGREFWGQGYATEGARACLDFAWTKWDLPEVVAFTFRGNAPSRRVMERIGMTHRPARDFQHSRVPAENPLRDHVLYAIKNPNRA